MAVFFFFLLSFIIYSEHYYTAAALTLTGCSLFHVRFPLVFTYLRSGWTEIGSFTLIHSGCLFHRIHALFIISSRAEMIVCCEIQPILHGLIEADQWAGRSFPVL